jgi:hypothetical protein
VGAHLIDEHRSPRIDAAILHAPQPSQEFVSFCCPFESFFGSYGGVLPLDKPLLPSPIPPDTAKQELGPLGVSSPRPLLELFGQQLCGFLV